jgi:hypothetical protein
MEGDDRVTTTDLYEGAYYMLGGCHIESVEVERVGRSPGCRLTFSGEKIRWLQQEYLAGHAVVGLTSFRRTLGQVNAWVWSAKKRARRKALEERIERGEA